MDRRRLLEEGACLDFEGMPCTVENLVGKGSDAIVYLASYPDRQQTDLRHRVLVKELFPYHPGGGIYRDDKGQICVSGDGRHTMELHRISFERGNEVHIRVQGSHPGELDYNINTFSLNGTLYSVLGFSGGRSLDNELDLPWSGKTPLTVHIRRLEGVLDVLEVFHGSGYLHLDISPENILLLGDGKKERVSLIDYNSVHTLKEIKNGECLYYSAKEGYTSAEVRRGRISSIGYASDLYSLTAVPFNYGQQADAPAGGQRNDSGYIKCRMPERTAGNGHPYGAADSGPGTGRVCQPEISECICHAPGSGRTEGPGGREGNHPLGVVGNRKGRRAAHGEGESGLCVYP